jgi:signal transduction histidine kinase
VLKSYSHLDQEAAATACDLHEGLDSTLALLDHLFGHGITVLRNYGAIPRVPAYVDELNQVWTNLIHNAVQAVNGNGTVVIETAREGDGVVVRIIDDGLGIPADAMPHIFEPFFTTKPKGEGTGLGLRIVRDIVAKHAGRVHAESRPGRTCFSVWLPLAGRAPSNPPRAGTGEVSS